MIIAVQAVFLRMFIAHLLGDFYLQKDEWVEDKRENIWRSKKLYIHSFLVAALTYPFSLAVLSPGSLSGLMNILSPAPGILP
ncbi:DUF3307 domain-containing protein [Methanoplanus limicola]|uniref:DUF3307 domain-containing protein n=1 Tax=Methanoplanus limicola DSM 2279 TaxID=937775 RepID=H1Z2Z8_9EURY|nr:DUF3307 domain-containing protein [Methanoplanus limicola]EHQ35538.1 hypothetical protein Metlim_1435 [Methanoplanus limicola DSM 2279]